MAKRYDAVVIGGGHNGLTSAAYLAKAGKSVLVLERRHVLGGAAVTEEIFPGFKFSVYSYVVSLLRPEIIRELELPKHGLEILPLDGTITPLDDDYLWRVNDHGTTIRELRRWSKNDAEAYEEYGQLMAEMARFIKPILSIVPPDPGQAQPDGLAAARRTGEGLQGPSDAAADHVHPADDHERGRLPGSVVRDRAVEGHHERVRHHRDVPGSAFSRHRVRAAPPLHGRDRRRVPRVGHPEGRDGRGQQRDRQRRALARRRDPHRGAGGAHRRRRAAARPASRWRAARSSRPAPCCRSVDSNLTFLKLLEPGTLDPDFEAEVRRYKYRGSSGKVNLALDGLPGARVQARRRSVAPRRDQLQPEPRLHGARVRRREVRPVQPAPVHRLHHADARRPVDGASRQAHHELLRAVRAVQAGARQGVGRRRTGGVRART